MTEDQLPRLLTHHVQHLRASGLTNATIVASGIYSETNREKLAAILNWKHPSKTISPALVFPFTAPDGTNGYNRVRPDVPRLDRNGKPIKYESPKKQPSHICLPPGVAAKLHDPSQEIAITEGEKKALALTQELL